VKLSLAPFCGILKEFIFFLGTISSQNIVSCRISSKLINDFLVVLRKFDKYFEMICNWEVVISFSLFLQDSKGIQTGLLVFLVFRVHKWHQNELLLIICVIFPNIWVAVDFSRDTQSNLIEIESSWSPSEAIS